MPTFTKLLDINIVPSNSSGWLNNSLMWLCFVDSSSSSSSSPAPREKNATSEPEIKADKSNRAISTTMKTTAVMVEASMVNNWSSVLGGSVSKFLLLVRLRRVGHVLGGSVSKFLLLVRLRRVGHLLLGLQQLMALCLPFFGRELVAKQPGHHSLKHLRLTCPRLPL